MRIDDLENGIGYGQPLRCKAWPLLPTSASVVLVQIGARVHLYRDVRQPSEITQTRLVPVYLHRMIGNECGDHRGVPWTHAPDVQIGHPISSDFQALSDLRGQPSVERSVEQDCS